MDDRIRIVWVGVFSLAADRRRPNSALRPSFGERCDGCQRRTPARAYFASWKMIPADYSRRRRSAAAPSAAFGRPRGTVPDTARAPPDNGPASASARSTRWRSPRAAHRASRAARRRARAADTGSTDTRRARNRAAPSPRAGGTSARPRKAPRAGRVPRRRVALGSWHGRARRARPRARSSRAPPRGPRSAPRAAAAAHRRRRWP